MDPMITDENMLARLAAYYEVKGIAPHDFRCCHAEACSAASPRFTTVKASFVGPEYAKGSGPRLLFLSLDSGSAEADPRRKTIEAVQHQELREDVGALAKNKHWYLTHELAWVLLRHFHPRLMITNTSPYFAHVNSAKCCQNKPQRGKAHGMLFENCREFIPGELAVLQPDIIVTQGDEAKKVIVQACRVVKHERKDVEGAAYETGLLDLVPGKQTLWLQTYHPNNYGKFHPQRKKCWPLYVEAVKQFVGGAPRQC